MSYVSRWGHEVSAANGHGLSSNWQEFAVSASNGTDRILFENGTGSLPSNRDELKHRQHSTISVAARV